MTTGSPQHRSKEAAIKISARSRLKGKLVVVAKTAAADVLHKTERGGVAVNLGTIAAGEEAYARIVPNCGPAVQIKRQVASGTEIILGMTNDDQFGLMVTVGPGGVMIELLGDVITFVPP